MSDALRTAQSIAGFSKNREPLDHYPTPEIAVTNLLKRGTFTGSIWEPCCGSGNIAKFLSDCYASDIRSDNIYGDGGVDFLQTYRVVDNIVTNPPYSKALEFVEHALRCSSRKVAMLCKLQFLEGSKRFYFFKENPPCRIYVFSKRLPLAKAEDNRKQSSMLAFAWYIWEKNIKTSPVIHWINTDEVQE